MTSIELIEHVTLTSNANIDFQNIPNTFDSLLIRASLRSTRSSSPDDLFALRFNNSSTSYKAIRLWGNAGNLNASTATTTYMHLNSLNASSADANAWAAIEIEIPNYRKSGSANRSAISQNVAMTDVTNANYLGFQGGTWLDSAIVNQITLYSLSASIATNSTATLYGLYHN